MSSVLDPPHTCVTSSICPGLPVSVREPVLTSNELTHSGTRNLTVKRSARFEFTVRVTWPSDGNVVSESTSTGAPRIWKRARPDVYRLMTRASGATAHVNCGIREIPRGPLETQHSTAWVNSFGPTHAV